MVVLKLTKVIDKTKVDRKVFKNIHSQLQISNHDSSFKTPSRKRKHEKYMQYSCDQKRACIEEGTPIEDKMNRFSFDSASSTLEPKLISHMEHLNSNMNIEYASQTDELTEELELLKSMLKF